MEERSLGELGPDLPPGCGWTHLIIILSSLGPETTSSTSTLCRIYPQPHLDVTSDNFIMHHDVRTWSFSWLCSIPIHCPARDVSDRGRYTRLVLPGLTWQAPR